MSSSGLRHDLSQTTEEEVFSAIASIAFSLVSLVPATILWAYISSGLLTSGLTFDGIITLLITAFPYLVAALVGLRPSRFRGRIAFARLAFFADFAALPTLAIGVLATIVGVGAGLT